MAFAKWHFDYLKTMGQWGAKSPDDKKIVAIAAEINTLKGQLKLHPKLSAIAKDNKKKNNKGDNKRDKKKKNKKDTSNKRFQKKDKEWKKVPPKNWTLKKRNKVPEDIQIVPSVWSMQCKCDLTTNEIKSHKARLNLHGGKQIY
jgi:hypothetical protein